MIKTHTGNEFIRDANGELMHGLLARNTLRQTNLSVSTTAVALPTSALSKRISIIIMNNSTGGQILYLGDSTVSSTNGFPIYPRGALQIALEDKALIYGISSASGADIRLLEGA